ncbi:MAG: F0F1 ATP synthase subunit A [Acidobacteriaceae bacterium]|nr:F0F1 ATP synthase subunit A [Acidobacteriaceae bacterium]
MVCEIIAVLVLVIICAALRSRLSVHNPGKLQHLVEITYDFVQACGEEIVGTVGIRYLPYFGTIFVFILAMNLIGIIPGFESPTMFPMVPLGLAVATFAFYHYAGIRQQGFRYIRQFLGPFWWLAWLMLPIELISQLARPLSLTVRLFANMFAGERVYLTFAALTRRRLAFSIPISSVRNIMKWPRRSSRRSSAIKICRILLRFLELMNWAMKTSKSSPERAGLSVFSRSRSMWRSSLLVAPANT